MKFVFKLVTTIHTFLYRLTKGRLGGKMMDFDVLLLTTTGRKSGTEYTSPLGYITDNGNYVICASNGGAPKHPSWYLNITRTPKVTVEVGDQKMTATAEIAEGPERERLWNALVAAAPSYKNYETKTTREIPMVVLRPVTSV